MSSMDVLDVGQANELKLAARRNDFTPEDLKWLCEGDTLASLRQVRLGFCEIVTCQFIVNLDAPPFIPAGFTVESHEPGGVFECNKDKVALLRSPMQLGGKTIEGNKLLSWWKKKRGMNANLLDYWLANQHLIPKECEGEYTFFPGTIYRDSDGNLYVRCLYRRGSRWVSHAYWLGGHWGERNPALVRAS